jgi:hypothetical protein
MPFQSPQVRTLRQWASYLPQVRQARSRGRTKRLNAAADWATEGTLPTAGAKASSRTAGRQRPRQDSSWPGVLSV